MIFTRHWRHGRRMKSEADAAAWAQIVLALEVDALDRRIARLQARRVAKIKELDRQGLRELLARAALR